MLGGWNLMLTMWKPGFEKMVRVGREKNFSSVFFIIDPVATLLGKPK